MLALISPIFNIVDVVEGGCAGVGVGVVVGAKCTFCCGFDTFCSCCSAHVFVLVEGTFCCVVRCVGVFEHLQKDVGLPKLGGVGAGEHKMYCLLGGAWVWMVLSPLLIFAQ